MFSHIIAIECLSKVSCLKYEHIYIYIFVCVYVIRLFHVDIFHTHIYRGIPVLVVVASWYTMKSNDFYSIVLTFHFLLYKCMVTHYMVCTWRSGCINIELIFFFQNYMSFQYPTRSQGLWHALTLTHLAGPR